MVIKIITKLWWFAIWLHFKAWL